MKKVLSLCLVIFLSVLISSCSFTTANLTDLKMASSVQDNLPVDVTNVFTTTSPEIYATGTLKNAPDGTTLTAEWYYLDESPEIFIDSATLEPTDVNTSFSFSLSIPDQGWPTGKYEVRFFIDDSTTAASKLSFTVQ